MKKVSIARIVVGAVVILALAIIFVLILTRHTCTCPFVDKEGKILKDSVAEQIYLPLGGVKQWVLVRGSNVYNPILIFLHGGPGISLHALFRYFNSELENHFIVVGWDQRGAGKSYNRAIPKESIKKETFVSDLHELVQYLKKRFNKDKVYILGESWGSMLGTLYAHKYPEDVIAYIGAGQVANTQESQRLGCEFVEAQAKKQNNKKAISQISKLKEPLCKDIEDRMIEADWLLKFGGSVYNKKSYPISWFVNMLCMDEYAWPDLLKITSGWKMTIKSLWPEIFAADFFKQVPQLKVPVYFLLGRHDHNTSAVVAAKYFDFLQAPKKELIWFEKSAHTPMFEEPERFLDVVLSIRYGDR